MNIARLVVTLVKQALRMRRVTSKEERPGKAKAAAPATAQSLLDDTRPASDLSRKELGGRIRAAQAFLETGGLSEDTAGKLRAMIKADQTVKRAARKLEQGNGQGAE